MRTPEARPRGANEPQATPPSDFRKDLARRRLDLRRLADEIRLKVHLGGMEARDAWSKLEPRIWEFEQKAAEATQEIAGELKNVGTTLKGELTRLRDRIIK